MLEGVILMNWVFWEYVSDMCGVCIGWMTLRYEVFTPRLSAFPLEG
jgi:hypothetical protein